MSLSVVVVVVVDVVVDVVVVVVVVGVVVIVLRTRHGFWLEFGKGCNGRFSCRCRCC